jgi:hypothetical protein
VQLQVASTQLLLLILVACSIWVQIQIDLQMLPSFSGIAVPAVAE